uniref:Proheparin-binding EGF-like growth factor n=1 Tax=Sinocyclocheilus grahami TaxID=75366 RepID=A0A672JXY1_SINGR
MKPALMVRSVTFPTSACSVRPITMHWVSWPIRADCACRKEGLCRKRSCIRLLYDIRSSWTDIIALSRSTVAFSTKPKHPSAIPTTEKKTKKGKRKAKGKGKGRKKNPCLEEYKDFCIHGACQHLKELNTHSCVCKAGYSGERCHIFTLPVIKKEQRYSRTTALAVIAVVLSLMCLAVIAILLALRYHKKDDADVESEEKVKLEVTSVQK